ncbi:MAG: hypothetical protein FJ295_20335 [Planctomycetes bacterium]|nr:hypothetical protein [Planctomycetota bacterium]
MPDQWEAMHGRNLQPHGRELYENDDNIEVFLNERAASLIAELPPITLPPIGSDRPTTATTGR